MTCNGPSISLPKLHTKLPQISTTKISLSQKAHVIISKKSTFFNSTLTFLYQCGRQSLIESCSFYFVMSFFSSNTAFPETISYQTKTEVNTFKLFFSKKAVMFFFFQCKAWWTPETPSLKTIGWWCLNVLLSFLSNKWVLPFLTRDLPSHPALSLS